jgi:hypothetical protein
MSRHSYELLSLFYNNDNGYYKINLIIKYLSKLPFITKYEINLIDKFLQKEKIDKSCFSYDLIDEYYNLSVKSLNTINLNSKTNLMIIIEKEYFSMLKYISENLNSELISQKNNLGKTVIDYLKVSSYPDVKTVKSNLFNEKIIKNTKLNNVTFFEIIPITIIDQILMNLTSLEIFHFADLNNYINNIYCQNPNSYFWKMKLKYIIKDEPIIIESSYLDRVYNLECLSDKLNNSSYDELNNILYRNNCSEYNIIQKIVSLGGYQLVINIEKQSLDNLDIYILIKENILYGLAKYGDFNIFKNYLITYEEEINNNSCIIHLKEKLFSYKKIINYSLIYKNYSIVEFFLERDFHKYICPVLKYATINDDFNFINKLPNDALSDIFNIFDCLFSYDYSKYYIRTNNPNIINWYINQGIDIISIFDNISKDETICDNDLLTMIQFLLQKNDISKYNINKTIFKSIKNNNIEVFKYLFPSIPRSIYIDLFKYACEKTDNIFIINKIYPYITLNTFELNELLDYATDNLFYQTIIQLIKWGATNFNPLKLKEYNITSELASFLSINYNIKVEKIYNDEYHIK